MYHFLIGLHFLVCLLLILIVLLQAGRGAGLAVFGGGGDALSSPSGSSFLKKFTAVLAGTFAVTSLMLTLLSGRVGSTSVTRGKFEVPLASQPATPPAEAPKVPEAKLEKAAAPSKAAPAPAKTEVPTEKK
ncbi:MAG: preprotein translocase subunit SecG [Elusimicrobiota bacterium]|jgi:preprotein translocase subunit SecG